MKTPLIYDKAMHEARKYWRDRLDSISIDGHLPLDHPRPKDGLQQVASVERPLDPDVHALLQRLGGGNPFLSFTALLSALQVCCWRYSGERRVTLFTPALSAAAAANLLPISSTLDGAATFKEVLLATKDLLTGAFANQHYPFSRLLLDLPDERRPKSLPLVAAMAGLNDAIPETPYDVAVVFATSAERAQATFRFDARLYDEATIVHFFGFFTALLRQGLADPARRIGDLWPASAAPEAPTPAETLPIHQAIAEQAARQPDRVALVEGDRTTTYAMLDREAGRLAETLATLGIGDGDLVGILMDPGSTAIAATLAVLRSGAAFTPDGAAQCIICSPDRVPDPDGRAVIAVAATGDGLELVERRAPETGRTGRTGPSGPLGPVGPGGPIACVMPDARSAVTHGELAGLFAWLNARCGVSADDRCLLSPGWTVGERLYDTLGLLSAGGSVEILDPAAARDTSRLAERLLDPSITLWDLPAPLAQNLLPELLARHAARPGVPGPRNVLLTGEKQSRDLADAFAQAFPQARITGLYAPPAVGIATTWFPLRDDASDSSGEVVAEAIPGFEHRVLLRTGDPAPPHTKGELHLRRSLSAPDTTVSTGLRAEARDGGRLVWLRGDDHCFVKYGCTVELTELETLLCRHEHIAAAEVLALQAEQEADRLVVAFLVADPERTSAEAVADDLVLRGDVDLIPDRFVLLGEFPLTAEGSVDANALAARFVTSPAATARRSAAVGDVHRQLKNIWLDILQVDDVGDDDSFFARGGNSLKATLLIARIRDEFSVDLSVQKFFREPSTRAVAELIAAESASASAPQKGPEFKIVPRERYRVQLPELEG